MHNIDINADKAYCSSPVCVERLSVGYRTRRHCRVVAGPLDATLQPGTLTCLIGRNGTGKSTLLRTIAGLQPPLGGTIRIGGTDMAGFGGAQLARTLGIVLTHRPEATNLTVEQTVALGRSPYTGFWGRLSAADNAVIDESMRRVGIEPMRGRRVCSLSDGECQKVMIAKAIAQHTPIVLLDEPTAFLDFPAKVELMLMLRHLAHEDGKVVLLSTHDLETALHTADRLWLMRGGGMSEGTPRQLAADGSIDRYIGRPDAALDPQTMNIMLRVNDEENDEE